MVEFGKMAQKKKAWYFQNDGKQPALNDISSKSDKHEHMLLQQEILKSINE